jgi:hypothetical protein
MKGADSPSPRHGKNIQAVGSNAGRLFFGPKISLKNSFSYLSPDTADQAA